MWTPESLYVFLAQNGYMPREVCKTGVYHGDDVIRQGRIIVGLCKKDAKTVCYTFNMDVIRAQYAHIVATLHVDDTPLPAQAVMIWLAEICSIYSVNADTDEVRQKMLEAMRRPQEKNP